MKKLSVLMVMLLAAAILAPAAYAQEGAGGAAANDSAKWLLIAGSFGMAIAAAGCGYAQSRVAAAACEGMARNPGAADPIRAAMFLGLVFVETLALFTLVVVLLFKFV